jgi:uncharacterized protein YpmS
MKRGKGWKRLIIILIALNEIRGIVFVIGVVAAWIIGKD